MAKASQQDIVTDAQNLINTWQPRAEAFLDTLAELATITFSPPAKQSNSWSFTSTKGDGSTFLDIINSAPNRPSPLTVTTPGVPTLTPQTIRDAETVDVPVFADSPPALAIPTAPVFVRPSAPTAPSLKDTALPDEPTITLASTPTLTVVTFPSVPTLEIPTFTETFPVTPTIIVPSNTYGFVDENPVAPLLDQITLDLLSDLQNSGGFGINTVDEQALADRLVDREAQAGLADEENMFKEFSLRGSRFPPGALAKAIHSASFERNQRINEAQRELTTSRQDLIRRARENAISQGISVDSQFLNFQSARLERSLNSARFAAEFSVAIFDASVRKYNSDLNAFNIFTQSYEVRIRALLAETDIFKTQVDAASAQLDAQKTQVDIFNAQNEAQQTLINLFTAQLQAARIKTEVEKNKLDIFRSEIQAFIGQIEAQDSEAKVFDTTVRGELAKQSTYQSQVDAYKSRVEAARITQEIENINVRTDIQKAELNLREFAANIDKFNAQLNAEVEEVKAQVDVFGADIDQYSRIKNLCPERSATNSHQSLHSSTTSCAYKN